MNKLLPKIDFLKKYQHSEENFKKTKLNWECLVDIHQTYLNEMAHLEQAGVTIMNTIRKFPGVHSVKFRVKDPEHLIEKIIRKRISNPELNVNKNNYKEVFTDLIGVRALHLFKNDWEKIHDKIIEIWNQKQEVEANYREGDTEENLQIYKDRGIKTKEHKFGYRSVHYIVETKPAKIKYFAELQVRTIFEEAWSEIDHTIRYPYDQENPIYGQFLLILNRLAGSADEMGGFVMKLKEEFRQKDIEHLLQIKEKENIINELKKQISASNIAIKEKSSIIESIDKLKTYTGTGFLNISGLDLNYFNKVSELPIFNVSKSVLPIYELGKLNDDCTYKSAARFQDYYKNIAPHVKNKLDKKAGQ